MTLFAEVVFPLPLNQSFLYIVPPALEAAARPGCRVLVPLGGKTLAGFVVELKDRGPDGPMSLKEIREVLDPEPVVSPRVLALTRKLSAHYGSSWGELLQAHLPPSRELKTSTKVLLTEKGKGALERGELAGGERLAADVLGTNVYSLLHVRRKSGVRNLSSLMARMRKKGLVEIQEEEKASVPAKSKPASSGPKAAQLELDFTIGPAVLEAAATIGKSIEEGRFAPFYVHAGRDARLALYVHLAQKAMAVKKQVLVLVPELSLSESLRETLEKRLGEKAAFFHGRLSDRARESEWRKIANGEARVVIGPRSALFSPLEKPGLIIVEDEQDESFFQAESPSYDARRGAWWSAEDQAAVAVFGSEIPSVEAYHRARKGGYLITLPLPGEKKKIVLADDRAERSLIARRLREGLGTGLAAGRSALVFLNRRGYASYLICPRCGHIPKCDRCEIALSYYKNDEKLVCRYCGASRPKSAACPRCGGRVMEPRGAGVEAVEEELKAAFPRARIASFDSDRIKTKSRRERVLAKFADGKIDILVGTQLLAHRDLPPVPFVGILNPESQLAVPDFRASQRTYQSLHRLARFVESGPSGGEVVIQTSAPDHPAIREAARQDFAAFYEAEISVRKLMGYPPFSFMTAIILSGRDLRPLARKARELSRCARTFSREIEVLGPSPALPAALRGEQGVEVILKAGNADLLDSCLGECLKSAGTKRTVVRFD